MTQPRVAELEQRLLTVIEAYTELKNSAQINEKLRDKYKRSCNRVHDLEVDLEEKRAECRALKELVKMLRDKSIDL